MTLPFLYRSGVKKKMEQNNIPAITSATTNNNSLLRGTSYPTLSLLIKKNNNHSHISTISSSSSPPLPLASATAAEEAATAATLEQDEQHEKEEKEEEKLGPDEIDQNFFYKHIRTHFHSLLCDSAIICIPHSKSIQGLVLTKDIIETHCFQPSPYFCGQFMATRQKHKIISLDFPIITTIRGFKEERTVNIRTEETLYIKYKKIRLLSIDRLLEGEAPQFNSHNQKRGIIIPPVRNSKIDFDFLNTFGGNPEALRELQTEVQGFTITYIYIKGYNRCTVERIQHMYMKTYRTILESNKLLQDSCRTPSEHDLFLELVENVVMSYLHNKIWIQSLHSLLSSQDNYLDTICFAYANVTLSQYSLRYPISEMRVSCFQEAIHHFKRLDSDHSNITEPHQMSLKTAQQQLAFTPLEKLAVVKSTLDLISAAVSSYIQDVGNGNSDTSVTADEMIPLLAFIIVQSKVSRMASNIYYMQYYRLARMVEGSIYSFVVTTLKTACEFLKSDPLSLNDTSSVHSNTSTSSSATTSPSPHLSSRSTSFVGTASPKKPNSAPPHHHSPQRLSINHKKSQSADLHRVIDLTPNSESFCVDGNNELINNKAELEEELEDDDEYGGTTSTTTTSGTAAILLPHIVLSNPRSRNTNKHSSSNSPLNENRKSLDIPNSWLLPAYNHNNNNSNNDRYKMIPSRNLGLSSSPMISTTFPSISNSTPLPMDEQTQPTTISNPKLGRSLSASTVVRNRLNIQQPPKVIHLRHDSSRILYDGNRRPASICIDTRSLHSIEDKTEEESEELMGDFLRGLSKLDGNVVGERTGSFKTFKRV